MKKCLISAALLGVFFGVVLWVTPALANTNPFQQTLLMITQVYCNVRTIIFVAAGFAFIGFAIAGMMGRIEWKKVAMLCAGLFLLFIAANAIEYFAGTMGHAGCGTTVQNRNW